MVINKRFDQLDLNIIRDWKVVMKKNINDYYYTEYLL